MEQEVKMVELKGIDAEETREAVENILEEAFDRDVMVHREDSPSDIYYGVGYMKAIRAFIILTLKHDKVIDLEPVPQYDFEGAVKNLMEKIMW